MINDFVSFRQAEELSNLGFNYRCFASYGYKSKAISISMDGHDSRIIAPTYSYAFDWMRDHAKMFPTIETFFDEGMMFGFNIGVVDDQGVVSKKNRDCLYESYREAQSECLDDMINMFKQIK